MGGREWSAAEEREVVEMESQGWGRRIGFARVDGREGCLGGASYGDGGGVVVEEEEELG